MRGYMFDEHFEIFLANDQASKAIHYSIRYQVYCEEMGFEDKSRFPMGQEKDDYDDDAVHFIVRHKASKHWVGAMRLILKKEIELPIESNAKLDQDIPPFQLSQSVELSRLCVIKELRRSGHSAESQNAPLNEELPTHSSTLNLLRDQYTNSRKIIWGLVHTAAAYCHENNISTCYFFSTDALAKILRKMGLNLHLIGDACDHNGRRYPFKTDIEEAYFNEAWGDNFKTGYKMFHVPSKKYSAKIAA
jgi:N-acyl amino acid synthase of PEP-CTERM/exosortase system